MVLVGILGTRAGRRQTAAETKGIPAIAPEDDMFSRTWPQLMAQWGKTLGRLTLSVVPEWLVIVFALGAARAWLLPLTHGWPFSIAALIGLAVAGTLFVIPTAAEIPIVQSLLFFGAAPGLAGALLLTLPAISLPSMIMTRRVFSVRLLASSAALVALIGIAAGAVAQIAL